MTGLERCVIQEVFQCVRPATGVAFAPKDYLRDTIGCDAKVVASAIAKATRLGWLHGEGRDRYRPYFARAVDAQKKSSEPESDQESGKFPDVHGETPRKNGKIPLPYKDSNTVTTYLSRSPVEDAVKSHKDGDPVDAHFSFFDLWQATCQSGKEGPARAAWSKLTAEERQDLSELVGKYPRIHLGDVWTSVWLNTKAWRDYKPAEPAAQALSQAAAPNAPDLETCKAWSGIQADLMSEPGSAAERFLGGAELKARVGNKVILAVTGSYAKEQLERFCCEQLAAKFSRSLGVEIVVAIRLRGPTNDDR
jgi:hypothetical protein